MLLIPVALAQGGPPPTVLSTVPDAPADPIFNREVEGIGLGVVLGLPTGFSFAARPGGRAWFDAALAWSFDRGTLHLHGDVLLTLADLRTDEIPDVRFPVWIGVGPRTRFGDSPYTLTQEIVNVGVRIPVGMSFIHDNVPLEAFLELAPGIGLYPATRGFFDVAIGGRYYLPKKKR